MMRLPPLSYLESAGAHADRVLPLLWFDLLLSIVVIILIGLLVFDGSRRRVASGGAAETRAVPIERRPGGMRWILIGLGISIVPLLISLVWTIHALAHVGTLPRNPRVAIDVVGRQYWWEARYDGGEPDLSFATANEIHIPAGEPVLIRLRGGDVIHSFWIPKLAGKIDAVPGQTNLLSIEADRPGRYRGQCTEYCGLQHAHMAMEVVAESRADFEAWRRAQLQTAPPPATAAQMRGLALVEHRCAVCHTVRGTTAFATAGPDLTHLMSRATIAAGTLPNNPGNLAGWIENPQGVKPGALMPDMALSAAELADLRAYLETLR
jgi:cytochrome c oxidase subunit 2